MGDPVTVVSEGGDTRNGVVMLGLHIDDKAPPSNDPHDHVTAYCDGATMTYNTKKSHSDMAGRTGRRGKNTR